MVVGYASNCEGDTIYCERRYPHIEAIFVFDVPQGHSSAAQRTGTFRERLLSRELGNVTPGT
jgi:hypothetical protein